MYSKLEKLYKTSSNIPTPEIISELINITLNGAQERTEITQSQLFTEISVLNSIYSKISLQWYSEYIASALNKMDMVRVEGDKIKINRVEKKITIKPEKEYGVYIYCREEIDLCKTARDSIIAVKIGKSNNISERVKQQTQTYGANPKILFKLHTENETDAKNLETLLHSISKLKSRGIDMTSGAKEWFSYSLNELYFLIHSVVIRALNIKCKLEDCYSKMQHAPTPPPPIKN